jgi:hypothetical protein
MPPVILVPANAGWEDPRAFRVRAISGTLALGGDGATLGDFTGSVKKAVYTAPVLSFSGPDLGAEAIQNALNRDNWNASVIPRLGERAATGWGTFWGGVTGNTTYSYPNAKLQVTLSRKDGIGFDPAVGQKVIADAAAQYLTLLKSFTEWAIAAADTAAADAGALNPVNIGKNAGDYWKTKFSEIGRIGLGPAFGLPGWFVPTITVGVVGIGGLLLASKAADVKKTFFGSAPTRRRKAKR